MDVIKVSTRQQSFNGEVYWKCGKYFQRYGKRLHRVVYEFYFGEIDASDHIHHVDFNARNNSIENLVCVGRNEHLSLHVKRNLELGKIKGFTKEMIDNAAVWHKSENGSAWHKQQYEKTKDRFHQKYERVCSFCGKNIMSARKNTPTAFCGNNCKASYRRKRIREEKNLMLIA